MLEWKARDASGQTTFMPASEDKDLQPRTDGTSRFPAGLALRSGPLGVGQHGGPG